MRDGGLMNDPGGAFATNNSEIEFTVKAPKVRTTCVKVRQGFAIFNVELACKVILDEGHGSHDFIHYNRDKNTCKAGTC